MSYLILDLAAAPLPNATDFITLDDIAAPANYKDPVKIDAYLAAERASRIDKAALDFDLARITAIGMWQDGVTSVVTCPDEASERAHLAALTVDWHGDVSARPILLTFNGLRYDLPLLMRRCQYLGVRVPALNLDRYRTPHVDLWDRLSNHGAHSAHALGWYMKRLGHTDLVKPLSGAEESRAAVEGRWDEVAAAVTHDVEATLRLAVWMGVL